MFNFINQKVTISRKFATALLAAQVVAGIASPLLDARIAAERQEAIMAAKAGKSPPSHWDD